MEEKLESQDLILVGAEIKLVAKLLEYFLRNRKFLQEFEPEREDDFFTLKKQFQVLERQIGERKLEKTYGFYIFEKENPNRLIGTIGIDNIIRGGFQSCFLGFRLDEEFINRGYMTQAVSVLTDYAFNRLKLHRIEANVMPKNQASIRVLEKSNYINEGLSKKYLKINGKWEDHIHMVALNEDL